MVGGREEEEGKGRGKGKEKGKGRDKRREEGGGKGRGLRKDKNWGRGIRERGGGNPRVVGNTFFLPHCILSEFFLSFLIHQFIFYNGINELIMSLRFICIF